MDHDIMGEAVSWCLIFFYTNDGMVGSRDAELLHHSMNVLFCLFWRYGLATNVAKSHTMTCQPSEIRSGMSVEVKSLKCTGVGYLYRMRLQ